MIYFLIGMAMLVLDFVTKRWALGVLKEVGSIPVLDGIFHLTYVENRGAAFGLFQNSQVIFVIVSIIALGGIFFVAKIYKNRSRILNFGLAFLAAGALGNMIDRLFYGFVVDFFDFCLINFPVFNVADICVCVAAGLLVVFVAFIEEKVKDDKGCKCDENVG